MTAAEIIRIVEAGSDAEVAAVIQELKSDPKDAESILRLVELSTRADVRGWVVGVAEELLGPRAATPFLVRLAGDRDSDVRSDALRALVRVDAAAARPFVENMRNTVRRRSDHEGLSAVRLLCQLGVRDARDEIIEFANRQGPDIWKRNLATSYLLLMDRDEDGLVTAIRKHDHDRMTWLTSAAALLPTAAVIAALRACAAGAPDADCRHSCEVTLRDVGVGGEVE